MTYADALRSTVGPVWGTLLVSEKKAALQAIEHHIALFEGRDERFVMVENMKDGYYGYYDHDDRNHLHLSPLAMRDPDEAVRTVLHEGRHAYQHDCIDNNAGFPQPIIDQFREGFENYVEPEKDFVAYAKNFTETDAESFAEQQVRLMDMDRNALLGREAAESEAPVTAHAREAEAEAEVPDASSRTETDLEEMLREAESMRARKSEAETHTAEAEAPDARSRREEELEGMLREDESMRAEKSEAEAHTAEAPDARSRYEEELEAMLRESENAPQRYDWKNQTTNPDMEWGKTLTMFRSESETNVKNLRDVDMSREDLEQYQDHFSSERLPGLPDETRGFMDVCLWEMQDSLDNHDSAGYSNARDRLLVWDELYRDDVGREASEKAKSVSAGEALDERDLPVAEAPGPDISTGTAEARDEIAAADREPDLTSGAEELYSVEVAAEHGLDLAPGAGESHGAVEAAERELDLTPGAEESCGVEEAAEYELNLAPGAEESRGAVESAERELDLAPSVEESRGTVEAHSAEGWADRSSDMSTGAGESRGTVEADGDAEDHSASQEEGISW